jgi:putative intracellular protease/amidase
VGRKLHVIEKGGTIMRDTVYVLVFEGFADWQVALALSEIRRPGEWEVHTVGFSRESVTSMSGLRVAPDCSLDELDLDAAALLIVPGGHVWLPHTSSKSPVRHVASTTRVRPWQRLTMVCLRSHAPV